MGLRRHASSGDRTSRYLGIRRRAWIVLVGAACAGTLTACSGLNSRTQLLHTGLLRSVRLHAGVTEGTRWTLGAFLDGYGHLCLRLMTPGHRNLSNYSCGFGPATNSGTELFDQVDLPDGTHLFFGPAPEATSRVVGGPQPLPKLSSTPPPDPNALRGQGWGCFPHSHQVVRSSLSGPLPTWAGSGKWFVIHVPKETSSCYSVTFVQPNGETLAPQSF